MNECGEAFVVLYFTYNLISRYTLLILLSIFYILYFRIPLIQCGNASFYVAGKTCCFAAIKREIYVPLFTFYPFSRSGGSATIGFDDSNYRKL